MRLTNGFDISSSALTAQRTRMDVISANVANAETGRAQFVNGKWVPYRRQVVEMETYKPKKTFDAFLNDALSDVGEGVKIRKIKEDQAPFKMMYNPTHPDADVNGYVQMPNVDILKEMVDMMSATRAYEANVTALNSTKAMFNKALEIGR